MIFLLVMVLYPDVQTRSRAEIDSVVGRDRLPTFEDRASLPYVDAVLREVLRWKPIGPLGDLRRYIILSLLKTILKAYHVLPQAQIHTMVISSHKVCCFCSKQIYINLNIGIVYQERQLCSTYGQTSPPQLLQC
jgi:hypothetical protein